MAVTHLYTVRGAARLQVEGDGVRGGEQLVGADPCAPPVCLDGVTIASYPVGAAPDAHVHCVSRVPEPGGKIVSKYKIK